MSRVGAFFTREFAGLPVWGGLLVVLAVAGVLAVALGGRGDDAPVASRADATEDLTAVGAGSPSPTASGAVALFIGDSYTVGVGAAPQSKRWTSLVAVEEGWEEANYGRGGTGYATAGTFNSCGLDDCPPYADMIATAARDGVEPDVVVIAGGQSDTDAWGADAAAVREAIDATFEEAAARFPDARIVAIGPSWPFSEESWQRDFNDAVREGAEAVGAEYISLLEPRVLDESFDAGDGQHVNDEGHAAIAERVIEQLG
ncbi:SGNH/GDSL hydrolase family protein [Demequina silvatica]|uniref:SGNH/GDSL hydrolase family protein n=1 Tax=Demequina silvatica TaxID=1638988 RepID=UPI0007835A67|nr:SGNH/GDSL hydrolase family protein [Demequina silvatica]